MGTEHQLAFVWASRAYYREDEREPHQRICWSCESGIGEYEDDNCEAGEDHAVPDLCLQCLPAEYRLED